MADARYSIYVSDPSGTRLADASTFVSLQYSRVVNEIGSLVLTLPSTFNTSMLRLPDGRIEVWRKLPGGREYLDTETVWLIKVVEYDRDDRGQVVIRVEADTPLCILREPGRFVNYNSSLSSSVVSSVAADDAIKTIVKQNAGSSATDTSRDLSAYLSVAANNTLAPTLTKSFAWREVLKVIQEIAASSAQAGTYLAFDIVAPTPSTLEFRTYVGQRGVDHRFPNGNNPVLIGPEFGDMGECSLRFDYRDEVTYALAGGQGNGAARVTASAQDNTRTGASPFGLREKFVDATSYDTTTGLTAEAQAVVRAGRARTIFKGKLLDTPDTRYGVHWGWGDFVTAQAFGQSIDCRIDAVTVKVERGKETIQAVLRNDA